MGRSIVAVALSVLMSISAVYAHDDANYIFNIADPGFDITSDFGPRYTTGTLFHKAIDFRRTAGQSLPLLGDGIVTDLLRGGSGWVGAANSENPLFHMPDRNTQYNVRVLDKDSNPRLDGFVVGPQDTKSSFVRVEVDSRTALDLEEVSIYVDQAVTANLIRQFKLGGNTEVKNFNYNIDSKAPVLSLTVTQN